jgi:hypothetical protein
MKMTRRLAVTYRGIGEFFREGGILVAVFGILDHVVHEGKIEATQVVGAVAFGVILLAVGLVFDRSTEPNDE